MTSPKSWPRPRYLTIDGHRYVAVYNGTDWTVESADTGHPLTHVSHEGISYIASGFPAKKWRSLEQAIIYTLTMRDA